MVSIEVVRGGFLQGKDSFLLHFFGLADVTLDSFAGCKSSPVVRREVGSCVLIEDAILSVLSDQVRSG